ncbi:MAG: hypothetical protein V4515_00245 [Chloroflexota bacterium]
MEGIVWIDEPAKRRGARGSAIVWRKPHAHPFDLSPQLTDLAEGLPVFGLCRLCFTERQSGTPGGRQQVPKGDVLARLDRDRAMAVAYEAGYRACAGLLVLAGYRVTSQPGHHRAAIEGAGALLGPSARPLFRRLDAA